MLTTVEMRRHAGSVYKMLGTTMHHRTQLISRTTPFICASCRRSAFHSVSPTISSSHRSFSSTGRRASEPSTSNSAEYRREAIAPQTHYEFFPQTFPDGPPPKSPFTPDLKQLRREFLQSQAKTHPDLAPQDQKRQAEALSMRVNEAYKTLQDPLKRAQYLLSLQGIDVEDESLKLSENELLMEVMEAREAVDEAESEEDLLPLREENNDRIAGSVGVLEHAFDVGEMQQAAQEAIRLRYWMNIEESIQGWEKGKGGGLVHH